MIEALVEAVMVAFAAVLTFSNKTFIGAVLPYIFSISAHPCPQATADIETECAKTDIKKLNFETYRYHI
jgi:hypothetical protein